jgi:hypothetical protein
MGGGGEIRGSVNSIDHLYHSRYYGGKVPDISIRATPLRWHLE